LEHYISPFSYLITKNHHTVWKTSLDEYFCSNELLCAWNIESLIDDSAWIIENILKSGWNSIHIKDLTTFLYTPTVLLKILNTLLIERNIWENDFVRIKEKTEGFSSWIFRADESVLSKLSEYKRDIESIDRKLLRFWDEYLADTISLSATNPLFAPRTADKILRNIRDYSRCVFLALWNGGIAPWIDVFNFLQENGQNVDFSFMTSKYSTQKARDKVPIFFPSEVEKLKELSREWSVVIFDEDCDSWLTLDGAKDFFSEVLEDNNSDLIVISNCWKYFYSPFERCNEWYH
jgi:hypothetical protein